MFVFINSGAPSGSWDVRGRCIRSGRCWCRCWCRLLVDEIVLPGVALCSGDLTVLVANFGEKVLGSELEGVRNGVLES
jgi:hypothetical protein